VGLVWWGEAPFRLFEVNEAAVVLTPKTLLGRKPPRAGICSAAAERRTLRLTYVTFLEFPSNAAAKR
jgi:hypothetical protein